MRGIMSSSLGVGLAVVSSLLLLALVAELYYIFWWKKRCNFKLKLSSVLFCFKAPTPIPVNPMMPRSGSDSDSGAGAGAGDSESASVAVTVDKGHEGGAPAPAPAVAVPATTGEEELQMDAELMRLHSLAGPPRFLFTIKEETREDLLLESDDGRSRSRLGDLLLHCTDSPFMTPLASPPLPLLQSKSKSLSLGVGVGVNFDSLKKLGFNPLFESMASPSPSLPLSLARSPPPKFKFLQEAEEKLRRKLSLLEASRPQPNGNPNTLLPSSISIQTEK